MLKLETKRRDKLAELILTKNQEAEAERIRKDSENTRKEKKERHIC